MKKTQLLLIRHGFTPANNAGWNKQEGIREYFRRDELCPLDKVYGIKQAKELGEYLTKYLKGQKVLILVGPYYRTKQTAFHAIQGLDPTLVTLEIEEPLREINQGLNYGEPKQAFEDDPEAQIYYEEMKSDHKVAVPYLMGESELDVKRRMRRFAKKVKQLQDSGEYDVIIVLSSETTMKWLYYWMFGKHHELKHATASVIEATENPRHLFIPETLVPKGHMVDFEDYKNYSTLSYFYELMEPLKGTPEFQKFFGNLTLPLEDESIFIEKRGETLIIPSGNTDKKGYFFIDCQYGQEAYTYDKESTSTYWILEGSGVFEVDGKRFEVNAGDVVTVPKNTTFYYSGQMKMIERMVPNYKEQNVVVVKELSDEEIKQGISLENNQKTKI